MIIQRFKWWLGYAFIRLGWRIYGVSEANINCLGCGIEENGIEYSINFVQKEGGQVDG